MSTSSKVSLGALRLAAQEASDFENNPAIPTETWNQFISQSYKRLYDLLTAAYGNDYYFANTYQFQTTSAQSYALPDGTPSFTDTTGAVAQKFYKLCGVDLQYSGSPNGFATLKRFEFIERNKYAVPNTLTTWAGYTNLRYHVQGDNLYLVPVPQTGQTVQIWYAPAPTSLQLRLPGYFVSGSSVIGSISDTTGILAGMNISANYTTGIIPSGASVQSVSTTTVTMSQNAQSTQNQTIFSAWNDSTSIEGISGWEQFVIVDAARKAMSKTEFDASDMKEERNAMLLDIQAMAEGRDIGQAFHVSDALGANAWGDDESGTGWGGGGGSW